jgi:hypothetical protein
VTVVVCLAGLVAAPVLAVLLVPSMGAMGGAVAILAVSAVGRFVLQRVMRHRLGLSASVLGGHELEIRDSRRSKIEVCGPDIARKFYGALVEAEHDKATRMWELFRDGPFVSPEVLRAEGPRLDFQYIDCVGTLKEAYVDYMTTDDVEGHPLPALIESAGTLLARIHSELDTPAVELWAPTESFRKDLESCGYSLDQLNAAPIVPLHCDFCLQNLGYTESGKLVVLDPSPDFCFTFHPHTHGPAYFDVGMLLSGLEGRVSPLKYPKLKWERVAALKSRMIDAYNMSASRPVDAGLATAVGFSLARDYFRARYHRVILVRAASWLLYNRTKGNDPRMSRDPSPQRA